MTIAGNSCGPHADNNTGHSYHAGHHQNHTVSPPPPASTVPCGLDLVWRGHMMCMELCLFWVFFLNGQKEEMRFWGIDENFQYFEKSEFLFHKWKLKSHSQHLQYFILPHCVRNVGGSRVRSRVRADVAILEIVSRYLCWVSPGPGQARLQFSPNPFIRIGSDPRTWSSKPSQIFDLYGW